MYQISYENRNNLLIALKRVRNEKITFKIVLEKKKCLNVI